VYRARRQPKCAKERRCIKRHRNNSDPLFVFLRNSFHTKTARPRPWPGLLALSLAACPAEAPRLAQMPCTPAAPRRTLRAERRCTLVDAASTLQTTPGLPTRSTRPGSSCFVDHVHDLRLLRLPPGLAGEVWWHTAWLWAAWWADARLCTCRSAALPLSSSGPERVPAKEHLGQIASAKL
jgi:hypothetical protein